VPKVAKPFLYAEAAADRVAAVRSLANLHDLTTLEFCVRDDAELLALAHAAAALARHKLTQRRLVVRLDSEVSNSGLIGLGQVSGLDLLHI
jgi:hypothetical protein